MQTADRRYNTVITRSVAKNRSATRPTKKGDTSEAIETVEKTLPTCVPVKCSVWVRYVLIVTYHDPQMQYSRNIIALSLVLTKAAINKCPSFAQVLALSAFARPRVIVVSRACASRCACRG